MTIDLFFMLLSIVKGYANVAASGKQASNETATGAAGPGVA